MNLLLSTKRKSTIYAVYACISFCMQKLYFCYGMLNTHMTNGWCSVVEEKTPQRKIHNIYNAYNTNLHLLSHSTARSSNSSTSSFISRIQQQQQQVPRACLRDAHQRRDKWRNIVVEAMCYAFGRLCFLSTLSLSLVCKSRLRDDVGKQHLSRNVSEWGLSLSSTPTL